MDCPQINLLVGHGRADVAGDVQVKIVLLDFFLCNSTRVTCFFRAVLIGFDDLLDVLRLKLVLPLAFLEMLGGVDEEHLVWFPALFECQNARRNASSSRGHFEILPTAGLRDVAISESAPFSVASFASAYFLSKRRFTARDCRVDM